MEEAEAVSLGLFAAVGAALALVVEALHGALDRARRALADLGGAERARALLLREFRHRTRNDLNALVGLLTLRTRTARSEEARDALRGATEHALALARVYARLAPEGAGGGDAVALDTRAFVAGLCADLEAAQAGGGLRPVALVAEAEAHSRRVRGAPTAGVPVRAPPHENATKGAMFGLFLHFKDACKTRCSRYRR